MTLQDLIKDLPEKHKEVLTNTYKAFQKTDPAMSKGEALGIMLKLLLDPYVDPRDRLPKTFKTKYVLQLADSVIDNDLFISEIELDIEHETKPKRKPRQSKVERLGFEVIE